MQKDQEKRITDLSGESKDVVVIDLELAKRIVHSLETIRFQDLKAKICEKVSSTSDSVKLFDYLKKELDFKEVTDKIIKTKFSFQ